MDKNITSKLTFALAVFLSLAIIFSTFARNLGTKSRVVFCDVGQGDGAYIRVENKVDIVVDTGPNRQILDCLGRYMPFYDRKIELVFISHPQIDHYGGMKYLVERYKIDHVIITSVLNNNQSYPELISSIRSRGIDLKQLYDDDYIAITSNAQIKYLWPTKKYVAQNTTLGLDKRQEDVLGSTSDDLNNFSEVFILTIGKFDILFTGDALPDILNEISLDREFANNKIEVLKIPHHGSKNGLTDMFLQKVRPEMSIISVAKKNRYGHPHPTVIEKLKKYGKPYYLTSNSGDVIIDFNGDGWHIKSTR